VRPPLHYTSISEYPEGIGRRPSTTKTVPSVVPLLLRTTLGDTNHHLAGHPTGWPNAPSLTPVQTLGSAVLSLLPATPRCCPPSPYSSYWSNNPMRTYPPGSLLKSPTQGASTLQQSPQLRRLTDHLRDLITIAYEACTSRRGSSLDLTRLEYASGERQGEKFCMRFDALVRAQDRSEPVRLKVTIIAEPETEQCFPL